MRVGRRWPSRRQLRRRAQRWGKRLHSFGRAVRREAKMFRRGGERQTGQSLENQNANVVWAGGGSDTYAGEGRRIFLPMTARSAKCAEGGGKTGNLCGGGGANGLPGEGSLACTWILASVGIFAQYFHVFWESRQASSARRGHVAAVACQRSGLISHLCFFRRTVQARTRSDGRFRDDFAPRHPRPHYLQSTEG